MIIDSQKPVMTRPAAIPSVLQPPNAVQCKDALGNAQRVLSLCPFPNRDRRSSAETRSQGYTKRLATVITERLCIKAANLFRQKRSSDNRVTIPRPASRRRANTGTGSCPQTYWARPKLMEHNLVYNPYFIRQDVIVPSESFRRRAGLETEV